MTTTVVNRRKTLRRTSDVYIGRPSPWGNPFAIGRDGTRAEVIEKYRRWITGPDRVAVALRANLHRLRGRRLVCWCAPAPCHGDVLAELADKEGAVVQVRDDRTTDAMRR
jgi:hypothetical protein